MRVRCYLQRLLVVVFGVGLISCGGGGSGGMSGVAPQPGPSSAAQGNLLIPQGGGSVQLPDTAGFSATMVLPENGNAAPVPVQATTSTTVPSEFSFVEAGSSALAPQAVTVPRTPLWYLFFTAFITYTVPGLPGFDLELPEHTTTAGKQFFIAFYDGTKWNYAVEGPATVKGDHVIFSGTHTPITFKKGVLYGFELYSQPVVNTIMTMPTSLTLSPGQSKTFQVNETGYTGSFTVGSCKSGTTTVANVTPSSAPGPSATVTVTGVAGGTCTIAITDGFMQTASVNVTVNAPLLTATPTSLTLTGSTTGNFTVNEPGYTGQFTIGTCTSGGQTIATASPTSAPGPSATITVTPAKAGSCTLAVSDANGQTTNVTVTVNAALAINPTTLQFPAAGPGALSQSVSVSEPGYTGAFTVTPCKQGATVVATLTPASISGPSATLTVAPQAAGICTVIVSDTLGQSATLNVSVTTATLQVNGTKRR